jgi:hypothetical protein
MLKFLAGVFSEPAPANSPSAARLIMGLFAVAAVGWVSYLVVTTKVIPDLWHIAAFVSSPYAINKASASLADFKR